MSLFPSLICHLNNHHPAIPGVQPLKAPLEGAAINLEAIRVDSRSELIEILEMHPGNKLLVLDASLGNLLSHVLTDATAVFNEHGVTQIMELGMDLSLIAAGSGGAALNFLHVLFFVRPTVEQAKLVSRQVAAVQKIHRAVERFSVYFAPHKTLLCEQVRTLCATFIRVACVSMCRPSPFAETTCHTPLTSGGVASDPRLSGAGLLQVFEDEGCLDVVDIGEVRTCDVPEKGGRWSAARLTLGNGHRSKLQQRQQRRAQMRSGVCGAVRGGAPYTPPPR